MFYIKMPCLVIRDGGFHLLGHSWRGDALAVVSALTGNVQSTATAGLLSVSVSGRQASLTRCCAVNENGLTDELQIEGLPRFIFYTWRYEGFRLRFRASRP